MATNDNSTIAKPNTSDILGYDADILNSILAGQPLIQSTIDTLQRFIDQILAISPADRTTNQKSRLLDYQERLATGVLTTDNQPGSTGIMTDDSYPVEFETTLENIEAKDSVDDLASFTMQNLQDYYKNLSGVVHIRLAEALFLKELTTFDPDRGEDLSHIYKKTTVLNGLHAAAIDAIQKAAITGDMTFVPTMNEGNFLDPELNDFSKESFDAAINEIMVEAETSTRFTDPFEVDRQFDAYSKQYIGRAPTAAEARNFKSQYRFLEETDSGFAPVIGGQTQNFLQENNPEEVLAQQSSNVSSIISKLSRSNLGQ